MYRISKDFSFAASHRLGGLPPGHKCARTHGHNYIVRIELARTALSSIGFVRDYEELSAVGEWLTNTWDHRDLNEVTTYEPTAENLARALWDVVTDLLIHQDDEQVSVGVSETPRTWAWYSEGV